MVTAMCTFFAKKFKIENNHSTLLVINVYKNGHAWNYS